MKILTLSLSIIVLTIFLSCLHTINSLQIKKSLATIPDIQTCKNLNFIFDLNKERFSGDWYLLLITSNYYTERYPNCWMLNFKNLNDTHAEAYPINRRFTTNPVELTFLINAVNNNTFYYERDDLPILFSFIGSDYENYAVFYACIDIEDDGRNFYVAGVFGRNKSLPQETLSQLQEEITRITGFTSFRNVTQDDEVCKPEIFS
jgi:hypothetical protein